MSNQRRAELYLLAVTIVWGSTFVITKSLLEQNSPLFYTGIRFLLATTLVVIFSPRRFLSIPRSTLIKGTVLGILLYIGFSVQTIGLEYTTASKSAFFTGLLVVLTPIVHYATQHRLGLERKPIRFGNIVGVILAAVGLYLFTSPAGGSFNLGDGLTLICAVCFAFYIVYLDSASAEPDKLQLTVVQFVVCGVMGLVSAFMLEAIHLGLTIGFLSQLLYLTIFATIVAMWVQNRYQGDTTPTRAAVIFSVEPVVAAAFAYFVRNESIGALGLLGGGVILLGVLVSELSEEIPILNYGFGVTEIR